MSGDSYGLQGRADDFSVDGDSGQLRIGAGTTRAAASVHLDA